MRMRDTGPNRYGAEVQEFMDLVQAYMNHRRAPLFTSSYAKVLEHLDFRYENLVQEVCRHQWRTVNEGKSVAVKDPEPEKVEQQAVRLAVVAIETCMWSRGRG